MENKSHLQSQSQSQEIKKLQDHDIENGEVKGSSERRSFVDMNFNDIINDNRRFLQRIRDRYDRVGVKFPTVEVRCKNLRIEAECEVVEGKPLPTLWNAFKSMISGMVKGILKIFGLKFREVNITILRDVSAIIKPSRMTLLLGPPGCGKTTLLLALAGMLDQSLKVTGEISYNGHPLEKFVPQKTSCYVRQHDLHIPEITVRETLDFSARCQGGGSRAELLKEIEKREEEAGIVPDSDLAAFMKAISVEGLNRSSQTDYIMKILGLNNCSNTTVGDAMRRGISGGEKKRVTLGEMIVGPSRVFFMDEISNGLDSSTTFQIVTCLQQSVHIMESTLLVSLLQPAPEVFNLFDDIILMAEGIVMCQGPHDRLLQFFESCGFRCPERKSAADFLQEVISMNDQFQYWYHPDQPYHYISVKQFAERFGAFSLGQNDVAEQLSQPVSTSKSHKDALSFSKYCLSKWEIFKVCTSREWLLMKRNSYVHVMKSLQLALLAIIMMTVFMRTQMNVDLVHGNYYMGALYFSVLLAMVNSIPELVMTVSRLPIFFKQRDSYFYPAWAFSVPSSLLKIPHSLISSLIWTSLTYFVIGYSPEVSRYFYQFLLLFTVHLMAGSMVRAIAALCRTFMAATTVGSIYRFVVISFSGFILPLDSIPGLLTWGFWTFPLAYAEIGITVNEFLAPRWRQKISSSNTSIGEKILRSRGLLYEGYFYWISVGALLGFIILYNIVFTLALTYLRSPVTSRAMISHEKLSQLQGRDNYKVETRQGTNTVSNFLSVILTEQKQGGMVLPFEPLALSFQDVQYFVDKPLEMRNRGATHKRIQLLQDVTGVFRPGVLTALMGISGAGKTTLFDVLSGRKTSGIIQGDIRIGGYPKLQETFSRISGYCEQNDIHSPHITVEETMILSAWLRLGPQIDQNTRKEFVAEVLKTIELDGIKDNLIGLLGASGLSIEQRKRLTVAVELVANPSILFIDEPTTGLDARTAAIVMRAVKNIVDTGRTVVCTIHQPSIDIFESFDELLLIKKGGQVIYSGQLGWHSKNVIEYFEGVSGVPKIRASYNPAAWMLEVTSTSVEEQLGIDFARIYKDSSLYRDTKYLVEQLSQPPPGSRKLQFSTRYSVNMWEQFKACVWKHYWSYWRSPDYNLKRILFSFFASLFFGFLFWQHGSNINREQDVFNIAGLIFSALNFQGINNAQSVQGFVMKDRLVLYRERFVGMYSSLAYSAAQLVVEIPYVIIQAAIYGIISYAFVGFQWSTYKFIWYLATMFLTMLYYTYAGMAIMAMSPNTEVSIIYSSYFFIMNIIFSGFLVPGPKVPKWWVWFYWICPSAWTLNALITSQYGDVRKEIEVLGERRWIKSFLKDYFGFQHEQLPLVATMLVAINLLFASLFVFCNAKLNFQRR